MKETKDVIQKNKGIPDKYEPMIKIHKYDVKMTRFQLWERAKKIKRTIAFIKKFEENIATAEKSIEKTKERNQKTGHEINSSEYCILCYEKSFRNCKAIIEATEMKKAKEVDSWSKVYDRDQETRELVKLR
ncbi:hypothetical protein K505DRAFT_380847 [Melanomma pulvis-pyrius CBS 109.77]|uniref:Uncharacterized protein n=1 Tax=Melanomma pulvis-pyrius CBS 109.77 TaxID=1314802 RepID=A0A6A6WNQ0_9PLEO|nr:hypothetical protein K505DRAFT_380847 [Melanomma pulvis-pyrius CBS 109.77]